MIAYVHYRRKFRSQFPTIWRDEKQRRTGRVREKRGVEERRSEKRKNQKKEDPGAREKVGKSRDTVFFTWFVAPEGRKVGSLKRRVRSQLARWEIKNCTPLWREAHVEVKHAQNTPGLDHFWKLRLRCRKSERRCGAKHISKSRCTKKHQVWTTFANCDCDVEKVQDVVARSTFRSQNVQSTSKHYIFAPLFGGSDALSRGRRKGLCICSKMSKMWGFCSISKNDGRRGTFEEDLQRCISRSRRSTKDMFIRDVRRSERWFPESGCILEHQICRFANMILRDRCSTSYGLASFFRGRRSTLDRWSGKIARRIGTRPSALHPTSIFEGNHAEFFRFWCCQLRNMRTSRRIASFLTLSSSKIGQVSQNCFVLDVVNFENDEVSQNCFVFNVVKFKHWGSLAE